MGQLKDEFFAETGIEWENDQGEPDMDYVNWLEAKVEKFNSTNKPSATCLLCGHMEVCYYYKHSGGGCCGKFVPRTSHVG